MKVRELQAEKHDLTDKMQLWEAQIPRLSGDAKTGLMGQYQAAAVRIREIDSLIAKSEQLNPSDRRNPGSMFSTNGQLGAIDMPSASAAHNGEVWADSRTGRPIPVLKPGQRMSALVSQAAGSDDPLSLERYLRGLITGRWEGAQRERELQASMGEGGSGTYLVPTPMSTQIIDKVRNASVMIRAGARTVPMEEASLSMARVATDMTPQWHTELAALTASDMTFERVSFAAQTLAAIGIVSVELVEDSVVDTVISDAIAKVLALELDRASLRGSGTAPEIKGIRNQSNVGVDTTTFTANGSTISGSAPTGAVAWDCLKRFVTLITGQRVGSGTEPESL